MTTGQQYARHFGIFLLGYAVIGFVGDLVVGSVAWSDSGITVGYVRGLSVGLWISAVHKWWPK